MTGSKASSPEAGHPLDSPFGWTALLRIPGIGSARLSRLLERYSTAREVLEADAAALRAIKGLDDSTVSHILRADADKLAQSAELEIQLASECGARVVSLRDPEYLATLAEIPAPPPVLYVRGRLEPRDVLSVAIVGTRRASHYALEMAHEIGKSLAASGVGVISGLARGIDTRAHIGALEGGGRTVGVLGCGVDVCYPQENRKLYRAMQLKGAIVSEFPMQTAPMAENFPKRNRIISGIAMATLVVEAPQSSGALITAQRALEQGREVFALPGRASDAASRGSNQLLREGATLVMSAEDILEELKEKIEEYRKCLPGVSVPRRSPEPVAPEEPDLFSGTALPDGDDARERLRALSREIGARPAKGEKAAAGVDAAATPPKPPVSPEVISSLTDEERRIYDSLGHEPVHIDSLARQLQSPVSHASRVLLMLEMRGLVTRQPGMMFVREG